jgi:hypothetical protein
MALLPPFGDIPKKFTGTEVEQNHDFPAKSSFARLATRLPFPQAAPSRLMKESLGGM